MCPYDGAGNFSLPAGYLAVTDTTIEVSQHNPPFEDIAGALSSVILRSGVAPMTGALNLTDGTVGLPGLSFSGDSNTGLRRVTTDTIALVTSGADRLTINASGAVTVVGSLAAATLSATTGTFLGATTVNNTLSVAGTATMAAISATTLATSGTITTNGSIRGNSGSTILENLVANGATIIASFGSAGIRLRANGSASAFGELNLQATGNVIINGTLTVTG